MRLIFFGGVQGVGKSTLLDWLLVEYKGKIQFLDPGELFRQYHYRQKIKTVEEIEDMAIEKILNFSRDDIVVLHWHYAVPRPDGYIPQVSSSRLELLASSKMIDSVTLLSLDAPVDIIYARRMKDSAQKKRNLTKEGIAEEIERDLEYMKKHADIFMAHLGVEKVSSHHIENINLDIAKSKLREIVLLGVLDSK